MALMYPQLHSNVSNLLAAVFICNFISIFTKNLFKNIFIKYLLNIFQEILIQLDINANDYDSIYILL